MTSLVLFAWLAYFSARLVYTCIDVHRDSMGRLR